MEDPQLPDIKLFQKHAADRFSDLISSHSDEETHDVTPTLLSASWLRYLLDAFLCCEAEFKAIIKFSKPPLDRLIPDHRDRHVKALDVCNAVTHGIDLLINWKRLSQIAVTSLNQKPVGEGQIRRAKNSLNNLLAISQPRWAEANGPATAVFIMNTVIVFVMWVLVAAIPCQERTGLTTHFQVPRNLSWTQNIIGLQEKIGDEWKKKEKKGGSGSLQEVTKMKKVANWFLEFSEKISFRGGERGGAGGIDRRDGGCLPENGRRSGSAAATGSGSFSQDGEK